MKIQSRTKYMRLALVFADGSMSVLSEQRGEDDALRERAFADAGEANPETRIAYIEVVVHAWIAERGPRKMVPGDL